MVARADKRENKDKASVAYNANDFISQSQNLTDQCKHLVEALSSASQECIICANPIYQRSALWNCRQCCQPFHLGCIKRWINKLNTGKEAAAEEENKEEEEEEKFGEDAWDGGERESESKAAARALCAFYSWTCPNCNYSYAENQLPRYKCFCGRYEEPGYNPMTLPHSCGEYCDRKKHDQCTHSRCDIHCHPGSCPPCSINVGVSCHCGKEKQRVPC